jgi:histidinol-phosphate/aromatic aminotransferase/cobyric acid decarboxylase-like protein
MYISDIMDTFNDTNTIDVGIGNPMYLNQALNKWFPMQNGFNYIAQKNHIATYTLSGWEPQNTIEQCKSFLGLIGYNDIILSTDGYEFYTQGNTQSVFSTIYALRTRAFQQENTLKVYAIGPTYFELGGICEILGVSYETFSNIASINSIPKINEYRLFYCASPNNPDGRIYNQITDIPSSSDAIYYDLSYAAPQYINGIYPIPTINSIMSLNMDCVVFGFSFSKIASASSRVSYTKVFSNSIPIESFQHCINSMTLGFSLGSINSIFNVLNVLSQNLSFYIEKTSNILQKNKEKVVNAVNTFFGPSNVIISPYSTGGFIWIYVPNQNPTEIFENIGILVKSGNVFFASSSPSNSNYCRINTTQSEEIIDAFCLKVYSSIV